MEIIQACTAFEPLVPIENNVTNAYLYLPLFNKQCSLILKEIKKLKKNLARNKCPRIFMLSW